jgi:hypothetical protein
VPGGFVPGGAASCGEWSTSRGPSQRSCVIARSRPRLS